MTNVAPPDSGSKWPNVAVHSATMNTRGERIKHARIRNRQTQMDVHKATGIGLRTIGRIETGQHENSRSAEVLEAYFGLSGTSVPVQADEQTADESAGDTPPPMAGHDPRTVMQLLTGAMELLAEATRQVAEVEFRTGERLTGAEPPRRLVWETKDAPSARRGQQGAPNRPDRDISG